MKHDFEIIDFHTYFTFEMGCLNGVALDCGEDKLDEREEYD